MPSGQGCRAKGSSYWERSIKMIIAVQVNWVFASPRIMSGESYISVVTEETLSQGTLLGPLPLTSGSPDSLAVLTWRCVDKLTTSSQVIKVNPKDQLNRPKPPSWLSHILPARRPEEQTLEIVVKGGQLYFRSVRDVEEGEELRAWFGQDLADLLKLPVIPPNVVEGEKRFECMLCKEQFENPFPVVAHLMYRCRRKEQGFSNLANPFKKKVGGRVKNFNIATLTDMNEKGECPRSPTTSVDIHPTKLLEDISVKRKKKQDQEDISVQKRLRSSSPDNSNESIDVSSSPPRKQQNGTAFKMASSPDTPTYQASLYSRVDLNHSDTNTSSAFKKVDKSSPPFHPSISLFAGGVDPREILFQTGSNTFSNFPYPMTTTSPSYPPMSQSLGLPSPMDGHMTSAFAPSSKISASSDQQMKMAEEYKMLRKDMGCFQQEMVGALMSPPINGARMPSMAPYHKPMEAFGGSAKTMPAPLLPFLPPSLAALSFPSQNWCAKCNASFRMTSDLVYHMRSHHKRETDPQKLKREEKLRCHICNETFRERHHLTRHMTSHQ
ncbi:hypothetical protein JTE90_025999 [Oedothorax gibbosus]|uniref:PR domain zinc finger protein 8 n=1 Tax=Oedothorax gibbosus TaxID=931172 RepID=A0AAV6UGW5_9ARAC|nr:hypothetical protein JTE90_025999 [Oedothorax gibbosus]